MNELATYVVQTLKEAGVNTVLQQDYLSNVGKGLLQYIIFQGLFFSILGLLMLIAIPAIYRNGRKKAIADKERSFGWDWGLEGMGHVLAIVILGLASIVLLCSGIPMIMKVFLVPDIAILEYIR